MGLMRGIRKNVKVIYWVVIVVVVVTFVFWGTIVRPGRGPSHAGIVFGEKVSAKEFDLQRFAARQQAIRYAYLTGQQINADQIESIAWRRIVELREADRSRVVVPTERVRERIRNTFSDQGEFDEESYRNYLQSRGLTERTFADMVRDDIRIAELERLVTAGVVVTPQELRERHSYDNEQRKIKFHMVKVDSLLPAFEVAAEAEQYYRAHTNEFREPRKVAVQYIMVEKESFLDKVSLPEEELRAYYEENKSSYKGADGKTAGFDEVRPQIERVLKARKADEMARQQAEKVLTLSDASRMREVARQNNLPFRETGFIPEEGSVTEEIAKEPQFRKSAFDTPPGEVSPIIETKPGYCVLSPVRVLPARLLPFEEAHKMAAERQRAERLRETARRAGVSGADIEAFVKEYSITPADTDVDYEDAWQYYQSHTSEFLKPKKVKAQYLLLENAAFEKDVKVTERDIKEEYSDHQDEYEDDNGKVKPLADVREDIEKNLRSKKADEMAQEVAYEIFAFYRPQRMKQQALDPKYLKYGLRVRESDLFARGETIDDYLGDSPAFADHAFRTKLGEVSDIFSTKKGYCVLSPVQVVDGAVADFEEVAEEVVEKARVNQAETLASRIAFQLYQEVRDKMTDEGKDFDAACKELGLKVEESGYFRRDDSVIEKVGPMAGYTASIFQSEPGKIGSPRRTPTGSLLYVVSEVKPPSEEEFAKERDSYYNRLANEKATQAFQEWMVALVREANVRRSLPVVRRREPERRAPAQPPKPAPPPRP